MAANSTNLLRRALPADTPVTITFPGGAQLDAVAVSVTDDGEALVTDGGLVSIWVNLAHVRSVEWARDDLPEGGAPQATQAPAKAEDLGDGVTAEGDPDPWERTGPGGDHFQAPTGRARHD